MFLPITFREIFTKRGLICPLDVQTRIFWNAAFSTAFTEKCRFFFCQSFKRWKISVFTKKFGFFYWQARLEKMKHLRFHEKIRIHRDVTNISDQRSRFQIIGRQFLLWTACSAVSRSVVSLCKVFIFELRRLWQYRWQILGLKRRPNIFFELVPINGEIWACGHINGKFWASNDGKIWAQFSDGLESSFAVNSTLKSSQLLLVFSLFTESQIRFEISSWDSILFTSGRCHSLLYKAR